MMFLYSCTILLCSIAYKILYIGDNSVVLSKPNLLTNLANFLA